jgi:hypothetical protein
VTCSTNEIYHAECPDSSWGTWTGSVSAADEDIPDTLNTWITDGHNIPVAPFSDPNDSAFCTSRGMCGSYWYAAGEGSTPFGTHWQSHTLEFNQDFPSGKYKIWVGEDLVEDGGGSEGDNSGLSCVNVFARFGPAPPPAPWVGDTQCDETTWPECVRSSI